MTKKEITEIFASSPLFTDSGSKTVEYASENCVITECAKGGKLFDNTKDKPSLCIILSGSAQVMGGTKSKPVILNTLSRGRVFGMASLFGGKCGSTAVVAKEKCIYAIISQECVEILLGMDVGFAKNYISFLSEKIRFLNKKIAFFTSESTEKKVAGYLLSLPYDESEKCVILDIKMAKLAQNLDIGRASLYRAFDSLTEQGFIEKTNNAVKINCYGEFKKIYGERL
ncbi:MAG: Crp/Fnr family transcriptional regulator [Clostridia bacterium]|nr:Crp/Fnr family transcriptional regulator [Clostridia bacterium]